MSNAVENQVDSEAPEHSSADDTEQLARRLIELLNARDLGALAKLQHPDVVDDFVAVGRYEGVAAVRGFFEEVFAAFPDFHIAIQAVSAAGNVATVQWQSTGTFNGSSPFQGVAPNGAKVELRGCDVMEFEDGRLRYNTIYYDGAGFARAVGMLPSQGSGLERAMFGAFNTVSSLRKQLRG
jgi:steroid delta-isomerase-like uncharacterized protein